MDLKNRSIKHWMIVVCCCGLAASSIGAVINTLGVFYAPVSESLGVLRATFTMHATFQSIAFGIAAIFMPKLMKKVNVKVLILVGGILAGGSTFLMAMATSVYTFYVLGVVKGLGAGLYNNLLITTIINHWFEEKNGLATSIVLSFSGVAGAVLSPILSSCITTMGWQTTYMILGIIIMALCVPALIYPFHMNPVKDGCLAYGAKEVHEKKQVEIVKSNFNPFQFNFILFTVFAVFVTAITYLTSHFPGYAESLQMSAAIGALMLSCGMIGNIGSKLLIGILSDMFGPVISTIIMTVFNIGALVTLLFIHNSYVMLVASVIFGSIYSIAAVGIALLTRYFFGYENYTSAYSLVCTVTNILGAFGLTFISLLYDIFGSYTFAFMIIIGIQLCNLAIVGYLVRHRTKIQYTNI